MENVVDMDNVKKERAGIKIKFVKPFSFEGVTHTGISLDLDSLTGKDILNAEVEARAMGDRTIMLEASKTYHMILAAKAANVPIDFLEQLPGKEFSKVTAQVQNFLFE